MADKPLLAAPHNYHVEFDRENGYKYACCMASTVATLATAGLALLCLPRLSWWQRKEVNTQKCTVTDKRVVLESGWINRSTRNIPLDCIQDINIKESLVQRCFGVTGVEIQTAGSGNGPHSEACLFAPADASTVRDIIMSRRDQLVLGHRHRANTAAGGGLDDTTVVGYDGTVVRELRDLKASIMRIEAQVSEGVKKLGKLGSETAIGSDNVQPFYWCLKWNNDQSKL